jgi:hypothetical protein
MEEDLLRLNMLTIAASGFLMLLTGLLLYLFRNTISDHLRYFLPIPPIGVGAYIFVYNMFSHYEGHLPDKMMTTLREVITSSVMVWGVFAVFVVLNISITYLLKRLF